MSGKFWVIMSGLHLQEVQGDLGFQVAQVDPADPANQIINVITSIKMLTLQPKLGFIQHRRRIFF